MVSEDLDLPIDLGHGVGPFYHVNTQGFVWNFDILSYNGPPDPPPSSKYQWIYTLGMGDNKKANNSNAEIIISYGIEDKPRQAPPSFIAIIRGHNVHDFYMPVRPGRYSASIIASDTATIFRLKNITTRKKETYYDDSTGDVWSLHKNIGASPEYHVVWSGNDLTPKIPFPDLYSIRLHQPTFIGPSTILASYYTANKQRICDSRCKSWYVNKCWNVDCIEIKCPQT